MGAIRARVRDAWPPDAPELRTSCPDLPGHGTATDVAADLWAAATSLLASNALPSTSIVGYSMGGRVALHAVLAHPERVERLVLIGATAGIEDPLGTRAAPEPQTTPSPIASTRSASNASSRNGSPVRSSPGSTPSTPDVEARLVNSAAGLATSLRHCGTGTQEPLWDRLAEIRCPTLVVAGEIDAKFTDLGRRLADAIPDARLEIVTGAGHSVHLEQPATTARLVASFLAG